MHNTNDRTAMPQKVFTIGELGTPGGTSGDGSPPVGCSRSKAPAVVPEDEVLLCACLIRATRANVNAFTCTFSMYYTTKGYTETE